VTRVERRPPQDGGIGSAVPGPPGGAARSEHGVPPRDRKNLAGPIKAAVDAIAQLPTIRNQNADVMAEKGLIMIGLTWVVVIAAALVGLALPAGGALTLTLIEADWPILAAWAVLGVSVAAALYLAGRRPVRAGQLVSGDRRSSNPSHARVGGGKSRAGSVVAYYRGFRIVAYERDGAWQARLDGFGTLSSFHTTNRAAIDELQRHVDKAPSLQPPASLKPSSTANAPSRAPCNEPSAAAKGTSNSSRC
jgi:hypothetical protein